LSDTIAGLAVDADTGKIELGGVHGYSGPGIKPLVLAEIYALRRQGPLDLVRESMVTGQGEAIRRSRM
jgi:hypothetical protein